MRQVAHLASSTRGCHHYHARWLVVTTFRSHLDCRWTRWGEDRNISVFRPTTFAKSTEASFARAAAPRPDRRSWARHRSATDPAVAAPWDGRLPVLRHRTGGESVASHWAYHLEPGS